MSDDELTPDAAAELRAIHEADQWAATVAAMAAFADTVKQIIAVIAEAADAFLRGFASGLRPFARGWQQWHSDVRVRAMLATQTDFDHQYAVQRANYRRRVRQHR